jgi:hypothetical protein
MRDRAEIMQKLNATCEGRKDLWQLHIRNILSSLPHRHQSAALISKIFQIKQGTAYHLEGTGQSLAYAEEAVRYARTSEDTTELVIALHELASIYEWALPSFSVDKSRKKALTLLLSIIPFLLLRVPQRNIHLMIFELHTLKRVLDPILCIGQVSI